MNYSFFATAKDKLAVLDYIFSNNELRVYDLHSAHGNQVSEYTSVDQISSKFDLEKGALYSVSLVLWSEAFKAKPYFKKWNLDPKRCNGHTFSYSTEGYGLIRLQFGGILNDLLHATNLSCATKKWALNNQSYSTHLGLVDDWDWTEVDTCIKKLKQYIDKKLSVRRLETFGVLQGASEICDAENTIYSGIVSIKK